MGKIVFDQEKGKTQTWRIVKLLRKLNQTWGPGLGLKTLETKFSSDYRVTFQVFRRPCAKIKSNIKQCNFGIEALKNVAQLDRTQFFSSKISPPFCGSDVFVLTLHLLYNIRVEWFFKNNNLTLAMLCQIFFRFPIPKPHFFYCYPKVTNF